jgi:hypothetical protein
LKRFRQRARSGGEKAPRDGDTPGVEPDELRSDSPRLLELRERYHGHPASRRSLWTDEYIDNEVSLRRFRADNAFNWQTRDGYTWDEPDARIDNWRIAPTTEAAYALSTYYVHLRDRLGLLERLTDDELFGNYTLVVDDRWLVSRDLLDSILQITFLDRHLSLTGRDDLRFVDIGAGYGRLALRLVQGVPTVERVICTDAIPESTYVSEYYLHFRGVDERAVVVALDQIESELHAGHVDVAVNVHSFSECPREAIIWWLDLVVSAGIPYLMIVPNTGVQLLSREADGAMLDFAPELRRRGFEQIACEPKYSGAPTVQRLGIYPAWHFLFARR